MPRVKRGTKRRARRKKILERASGYYLTKSKLYRSAKESVERGLKFAYSGRKQKKRQFRSIWIVRIGAAAKLNGLSYSVVHQWPEEGRHRAGPQDPCRSGGQRSRRIYGAVQAGASRHGIAAHPQSVSLGGPVPPEPQEQFAVAPTMGGPAVAARCASAVVGADSQFSEIAHD